MRPTSVATRSGVAFGVHSDIDHVAARSGVAFGVHSDIDHVAARSGAQASLTPGA